MVFSPRVLVVNQQKNVDYESDNVKDKTNLLSYNLWSGGDYLKNTTGHGNINEGISVELSSNYKSNGEYSFKYTSSLNQYQGVSSPQIILPDNTSKATLSLTVLNLTGGNIEIRLIQNDYKTISVPPSETSQEITLEKDVTNTSIQIIFIFRSANITAYIDSMRLTAL